MKKVFIILTISIVSLISFSGCEEEGSVFNCDACDCSGDLTSSVNCYGTTQSGSGCNNNTLNSCGYCYLHTSQCCL